MNDDDGDNEMNCNNNLIPVLYPLVVQSDTLEGTQPVCPCFQG